MPSVAEATKLLGRSSDLLALLAALPLLSQVKFGALLRAQELAAKRAKQAAEAKRAAEAQAPPGTGPDTAAEGADAGADDEGDYEPCVPPAWTFFLFLLAELCACMQLFDPTDKQVRRGVGEMARLQQTATPGVHGTIAALEKLLANSDVYELVRFGAVCAGLGSLLVTTTLELHIPSPEVSEGHPLKVMKRAAVRLVQKIWAPRLWFFLALASAVALGNQSALLKAARRPGTVELVRAAAVLLRALAVGGAVTATQHGGPMPLWATLTAAGAVARGARSFMYERVPLATLMDFAAGGSAAGVRATVALEAWSALMLLPCVCRRARMVLLFILLVAPCVVLLNGGQWARLLEPYVELTLQRMNICVAVMALATVFMGGFPTMMTCLLLGQALIYIHKLDTLKF